MKKIIILILPLFILFSCSVQKRKYQKGFYVSSSRAKTQSKKNTTEPVAVKKEKTKEKYTPVVTEQETETKPQVEASADLSLKPLKLKEKTIFSLQKDDPCDLITLKNGEEVSVKVLEITSIEVKYKKCDAPDGPLYVVKKSDVFMIKYANGTKEVLKSSEEPKNSQSNSSSNSNQNSSNNGGAKTTHELAIFALVAGILGLVAGLGSIPAIILGNSAIKKIKAEPDKYDGLDLARIGKILGIIGMVIKAFFIILIIVLVFATI